MSLASYPLRATHSQCLNILIIGAVVILKRFAKNYSSSSYNYSKLFRTILGLPLHSLSINISTLNLNSFGSSKIYTSIFLSSNLAGTYWGSVYGQENKIDYNITNIYSLSQWALHNMYHIIHCLRNLQMFPSPIAYPMVILQCNAKSLSFEKLYGLFGFSKQCSGVMEM